ncbi:hypothetical protein F5B21DRAFT_527217 [Xylaria acuta]|nr:hypothetical protein F5B21DRAFT_527217 [Xylaria acuta]
MNVAQTKWYQIAKVHRRNQPKITRGRLREFYQCDFDVAGLCDSMIPGIEVLQVIIEVFEVLELEVSMKTNHGQYYQILMRGASVDKGKTAESKGEFPLDQGHALEISLVENYLPGHHSYYENSSMGL